MYKTISISSGLYPNLDLWNANKLQLQLQFTGIKIFNRLPQSIKKLSSDTNKFKRELKKFLL